jgi:hypothetical protein
VKKIVHCVYIGDYFPDLWQYTLPTIKLYANRINADLNIITERKFPEWHINYEKMQVWEDGKGADLNLLVDADVLIHPYFPDIEQIIPLHHVAFQESYNASRKFKLNECFERDGRDVGVVSNVVVSGKSTHCLWEPLNISPDEGKKITIVREGDIDEYNLSRNVAKYGLKYTGVTWEDWHKEYLIHIGTEDKNSSVKFAEKMIHEWNKL